MYRCDWCAQEIHVGDTLVNLAIFVLSEHGPTESTFEDGSPELTFHADCFVRNARPGIVTERFESFGCAYCDDEFPPWSRIVMLTEHSVTRGPRSGKAYLLDRSFPDGTRERDYCYDCFSILVDPTLLGADLAPW